MRFTPPRLAKRLIAGLVIPWIFWRSIFLCRLAPPLPNPLPPRPRPEILFIYFTGLLFSQNIWIVIKIAKISAIYTHWLLRTNVSFLFCIVHPDDFDMLSNYYFVFYRALANVSYNYQIKVFYGIFIWFLPFT